MKLGILGLATLVLILAAALKSVALAGVGVLLFGLLFYLREKTPH